MNYVEAQAFINSFSRLGKKVSDLSRIKELLDSLGNPQEKLKFVHIAGTNGKGSTLEYISAALKNAGYKTGQFTSPYVIHYADRIRINSVEIDENSICEICEFVAANIQKKEYSQFEITMSIAFLYFLREKCDIVVLETGIGGLLDSTNIIPPPLLSVITSISLDHTAILGNTIEEIATQKAGIIKKKSVTILSVDNPPNVAKIIRKTAEKNCSFFVQPLKCNLKLIDSGSYGVRFIYKKSFKSSEYITAMSGDFQCYNAVTAIEACWYLRTVHGFKITDENVKEAIATARVQARLQYILGRPTVIVDGGHNPDAIKHLYYNMLQEKSNGKKIYTITGMSDTKDYKENLKFICAFSEKLFAVDDFMPNSVPAQELAKIAAEFVDAEANTLSDAVEKAKALALENNGLVLVCGSLYLASNYLNLYQ